MRPFGAGLRATAERSSEIFYRDPRPKLLSTLAPTGCTVTIDAMSTQSAIATATQDGGAEYVLSGQGQPGQTGRVDRRLPAQLPRSSGQTHPRTLVRPERGEGSWPAGDTQLLRARSTGNTLISPSNGRVCVALQCSHPTHRRQNQLRTTRLHQQSGFRRATYQSRYTLSLGGRDPFALVHGRIV
jgi:hypothetical protein